MPAIQPIRLKEQVSLLTKSYSDPQAYVRSLHELLESFSDNTHRSGQAGKPAPLTQAYKVPTPILRQIHSDLIPWVKEDPLSALELCDALWAEPILEFKMLAGMTLGFIPLDDPKPVLHRVNAWIQPELEDFLVIHLLTYALVNARKENQPSILSLAQNWLDNSGSFYPKLGLRLLQSTVEDANFENLPAIFRLIHPLCQTAPVALRQDLLDLLRVLVNRSPQETSYFLRQTLSLPNAPDTRWLIRQVIGNFPPSIQESLRSAMRATEL